MLKKGDEFSFYVRIYYEDTDAGGVVYHSNYLKFAERARTEFLRSKNINQTELKKQNDTQFVLKTANLELIKPSYLDDEIQIVTTVKDIRAASLHMEQLFYRNQVKIAELDVVIVSVDSSLKVKRVRW